MQYYQMMATMKQNISIQIHTNDVLLKNYEDTNIT